VLAAGDQVEQDVAAGGDAAAGLGRQILRLQQDRWCRLRCEDMYVDPGRNDSVQQAARHFHGHVVRVDEIHRGQVAVCGAVDVADHPVVILYRAVAEVPPVTQVGAGIGCHAQMHHMAHEDIVIGGDLRPVGPFHKAVDVRRALHGLQVDLIVIHLDVGRVQPHAVERLDRYGRGRVAAKQCGADPQGQRAGGRSAGRVHAREADRARNPGIV